MNLKKKKPWQVKRFGGKEKNPTKQMSCGKALVCNFALHLKTPTSSWFAHQGKRQ